MERVSSGSPSCGTLHSSAVSVTAPRNTEAPQLASIAQGERASDWLQSTSTAMSALDESLLNDALVLTARGRALATTLTELLGFGKELRAAASSARRAAAETRNEGVRHREAGHQRRLIERRILSSPEYRVVIQEALANARRVVIGYVGWLVYELPPPVLDRRSTRSLIFENESVIRRVRNFPIDWRVLTDDKLFELSWNV